jgi:hypothetical protein
MEELKNILKHPEIVLALGKDGIKEIVMRALIAYYRFRNAQRVFGVVLCVPFFVLAYVSTTQPKLVVKDWVWYGCAVCLFVGLSFFFPKQAEPLYNLLMRKMGAPLPIENEEVKNTKDNQNTPITNG